MEKEKVGSEVSDEELIQYIKNGDENAENELFSRYKDYVVKIARGYYIVGGEMEDLIQEGMIGLYRAIKAYDASRGDAKFKTYAITCIKHKIQTAITKANSKKQKTLSDAISFQSFTDSVDGVEDVLPLDLIMEDTPADKMINKENFEFLKQFLTKNLSKLELDVLKLFLQGYSYREIAKLLNTTRKSIDNCLFRIKNKLKEKLSEKTDEQQAL